MRPNKIEREAWRDNGKHDKEATLDKVLIPKGSIIRYKGMPFKLEFDIFVLGKKENFKLASLR